MILRSHLLFNDLVNIWVLVSFHSPFIRSVVLPVSDILSAAFFRSLEGARGTARGVERRDPSSPAPSQDRSSRTRTETGHAMDCENARSNVARHRTRGTYLSHMVTNVMRKSIGCSEWLRII